MSNPGSSDSNSENEKEKQREDSAAPESFTEKELIDLEFESMVEGLNLDQSTPNTYLDDLDNSTDENRFHAPAPEKIGWRESLKRARNSFQKWKSGPTSLDGDGAAL